MIVTLQKMFRSCTVYPLEKIDEAARSAKYIFKKIILTKLIVTLQKMFRSCAVYPLEKIDEAARSAKYIFKKIMLPKLICRIPVVTLQKMFWSCTVPLRKKWWSGEVSETHLKKITLPKLICRIPVVTLQKMFRSWVATANGTGPVTFGNGQLSHLKLGPRIYCQTCKMKKIFFGNTENTYHLNSYKSMANITQVSQQRKLTMWRSSSSLHQVLWKMLWFQFWTLVKYLPILWMRLAFPALATLIENSGSFPGERVTILPLMTMCQYPCMVTKFK